MIAINTLLIIIALSIPFFVGAVVTKESFLNSYLNGQLMIWALFELIAVPVIWFRLPFYVLFISYIAVLAILSIVGIKRGIALLKGIEKPAVNIVYILAILVIAFQMAMYLFGMHLDEDDARWIAEANDALTKGRMLLDNPATGEYLGSFRGEMVKDVFSPWAMFIACFARFTGVRPVVIAHTVYAPVLLGLSYIIYHEITKLLFKGSTERGLFLLSVAVINMFFGGNPYTQSVFSLVRIWQGKAVVAAVIIPVILMMILRIQKNDDIGDWLLLTVVGCAACLFSGMGIAIGFIMIGAYGAYVCAFGHIKRVGLWVVALVPSVLLGLSYYMLRG